MGERVRLHGAGGFFLEIIVADHFGAVEGFPDVAVVQGTVAVVLVVAPDAGIEIGLEFQPDADFVGFAPAHPRHLLMGFPQGSQQVLHMVAHLVGNHVGIGEIPARAQLAFHAGEEGEVDIDALVG